MLIRLSVTSPAHSDTDVAVTAQDAAAVGDLACALGAANLAVIGPDGPRPLDLTAPLLTSGVHDGSVLWTGTLPSCNVRPPAPACWALRVTSGSQAGRVLPLPVGIATLGRQAVNTHVIDDLEISRAHARLTTDQHGVLLEDLASANGSFVGGQRIQVPTRLRAGDRVQFGDTVLSVERLGGGSATTVPDGQGGLVLNRALSRRRALPPTRIELPVPPSPAEPRGFPWVLALVPLAAAVALALVMQQATFLLFAVLSPVTMGANLWNERRVDRRRRASVVAAHQESSEQAYGAIAAALRAEGDFLATAYPGGADCVQLAVGRDVRVWERSLDDVDSLGVRLGTGERKGSVEVVLPRGAEQPPVTLPHAPLVVDLREAEVLGLAGVRADVDALARSVVLQLATLHSPDELHLYLLDQDGPSAGWDFFRWLPHAWDQESRTARIAYREDSLSARVKELRALVESRSARSAGYGDVAPVSPSVVVILAGAAQLRRRADVADLLERGPGAGVYAVALEEDGRFLPEECRAVALARPDGTGLTVQLRVAGSSGLVTGAADTCPAEAAAEAARALAPLRRVAGGARPGAGVPATARLVTLLGGMPDAARAAVQWDRRAAAGEARLRVPLGVGSAGPVTVDLVEDGPHALIGGTTGMGKSEFVKSWVTAMAAIAPPEDLSFLFVEFKGITAFRDLQHLPHAVGSITNLDLTMAHRALESLRAELTRRQRQLATASADDIGDYLRRRRDLPDLLPFPRLLIVVDEFAEMKAQVPGFVDGLVSVAQTGRSLGVHLILATQRPGAAVTGDITGNTAVRVCLRTQNPDDSHLVIDSGVAADLPASAKGRAYIKVGERPPVLLQTARVGGPAEGMAQGVTVRSWLPEDTPYAVAAPAANGQAGDSDLEALVRVLREAAAQAGRTAPFRPWVDPLPQVVPLEAVTPWAADPDTHAQQALAAAGPIVGLLDEPHAQRQTAFALPLMRGHVAVAGGPRSGRTTLLRTAVASWTAALSPELLHVHVVDGARTSLGLRALPQVGSVLTLEDERLPRLLGILAEEMDRRLTLLGEAGLGDVLEQWQRVSPADRLPWTLLVIDRFDLLLEQVGNTAEGAVLERIITLGPATGVTVLATSDETLLRGRWAARFPVRLVLQLTGTDSAMVGLPSRLPLDALGPGRAYESADGLAVQIAVLGSDPSIAEQLREFAALTDVLATRWPHLPRSAPASLQELPQKLSAASLVPPASPGSVPLGRGGDTASPVVLDDADLPLVVLGAPGTGRSTALRRVATAWSQGGERVIVLAAEGSPLHDLAANDLIPRGPEVTDVTDDRDWATTLADPAARVVVDDVDQDAIPAAFISALTDCQPRCRLAVSARLTTLPATPIRRLQRQGAVLLLAPLERHHGQEFGVSLSGPVKGPVGRAILVRDGSGLAVQVAADV